MSDDLARIDAVEVEPLSDDDLESVGGGSVDAAENNASTGCITNNAETGCTIKPSSGFA